MSLAPFKKGLEEGEHGLVSLRDEMNRLFDSFWRGQLGLEPLRDWGRFTPALDVVEDENAYTIKADTPGLDAKDIEISVTGNVLTIKGAKSEEEEDKGKNYYRSERRYGEFSRTVTLPSSVDPEKVKAECKKGVLKITLPKSEKDKSKKIEVKGE